MYEKLRGHIEQLTPEIIRFVREIIRTPSNSLREEAVAAQVQDLMERLEYDQVFRDDAGNDVGVIIGSDSGPTVLLNAHMDTVTANPALWDSDPLSDRVEAGRIIGLGAADCKGGLAAQIFAGHVLSKSALPLRGDLVVAATVAEENGCSVGARHLLEGTLARLGMRPSYAVLGEPTGLSLCYGHDGWVMLDICIKGADLLAVRQAATLVMQDIRYAGRGVNGRNGSPLNATEPEMRFGADAVEATIRMSRPVFPGESADYCLEQARKRIAEAAEPIAAVSIEVSPHTEQQRFYTGKVVDVMCKTESWLTDPYQPIFDRMREGLKIAGWDTVPLETWKLDRDGMGTAGSMLAAECGIPTFGFGPGELAQAHAPNESVAIDKLVDAVYGTAVLAHSLIGAPLHTLMHQ
jgi:acetylornithine deacetylase/succinyl-diaminopimelate desuccinylase-like protein